jgi:protein-tyrosine-phosphatase
MKKVMFACRKNSCRSQIAEGFAKTLGAGKIAVTSSGLEAAKVHPGAIEVMMPLSPYVVAVSICRKDGFYRKFSRIG